MPLYSDSYYYGGSQPPPYYLPSSAYSPVTSRISSPYSYSYMSPMSVLSAGIGVNPVPRGLRSYSPMLTSISETSSPLLPRRDIEHRSSPRRLAGKTFYRQPRPTVIDTEHLDLSRRKKDSEDGESTPGMISRTKSIVRIHTKKLKENPDLKKKKTQAELLMEKYLIKEKPIEEKESPKKKWSWEEQDKTPARRGTIKRRESLSRVNQLQVPLVENETNITSASEVEVTPSRKMSIDSELLKVEAAIFDCLIQEELGPNNKKEVLPDDVDLESSTDGQEHLISKMKTKRDSVPYVRKKSSNKLLDENGMPILDKKKSRVHKKKSSDKLILDEMKSIESPSDSDLKPEFSNKPMKRRSTKKKKHGGALKFKIDSLHVEEKSSPKMLRKFKYEVIVEEGNANDKHSADICQKDVEVSQSDNAEKDIPYRDNHEMGDVKKDNDKTNEQEAKCDSNINKVNLTDNVSNSKTERYKNKFPLKGKLLKRQFNVESDSDSATASPVIVKDMKSKTEVEQSIQEQSQNITADILTEDVRQTAKAVLCGSNSMKGIESVHSKSENHEYDRADTDRIGEDGNKDLNNRIHTSADCDSTKSNLPVSKKFAQTRPSNAGLPPHARPETPDLSSPKGMPLDKDENKTVIFDKSDKSYSKSSIQPKLHNKALPPHSRSNTPDLIIGQNKSLDAESLVSESSNMPDKNVLIHGKPHDRLLLSQSRSITPDLQSPNNKSFDNGSSKSSISENSNMPDTNVIIRGKPHDRLLLSQSRSITPDLQSPKNKSFDNGSSKSSVSENSSSSDAKLLNQGKISDKALPPSSRSNTPDLSSTKNKTLDDHKQSCVPKNDIALDQKPFPGKLREKVLPSHSRSNTPDLNSPKTKSFDSDSTKSSTPDRSNELQPKHIIGKKSEDTFLLSQSRSSTPDITSSKGNEKIQNKGLPPNYRSKTPDLSKKAIKNEASKSDPSTPILFRKKLIEQPDNKTKIDTKESSKIYNPGLAVDKNLKQNDTQKINNQNLCDVETTELSNANLQESSNKTGKHVEESHGSQECGIKQSSSNPKGKDFKTPINKSPFAKPENKINLSQQTKTRSEISPALNESSSKIEPTTASESNTLSKNIECNIGDKSNSSGKINNDKVAAKSVEGSTLVQDGDSVVTDSKPAAGKNNIQSNIKNVLPKTGHSTNKLAETPGKNLVSKVALKSIDKVKSANKSEGLKANNKLNNQINNSKPIDVNNTSFNVENKPGSEICLSDKDRLTASNNDSSNRCARENEPSKIESGKEGILINRLSSKTDTKITSETVSESNLQDLGSENNIEKGSKGGKATNKKKARPKSESDMVENVDANLESKTKASSVEEENKTSKKSNSLPKSHSKNSSGKKKKSKDKKSDSKSPKKLKRATTNTDKNQENDAQSEEKSDVKKNDGENSSELSKRSTRLMHFINKCMKLSADNESLSIEISDEEAEEEEESSSEYTSDSSEYTDDSSSEEESSDEQKGSTESRDRGSPSRRQSNAALSLDEVRSESHHPGRVTPPATTIPKFRKYTMDDFQFLKVLGKGSFGKVLLAELRGTQYYYAVKCLKKDVVLEDDDVECTLIERKVLALGTNHPYLCHLFCTFQTESHLFFVMEYLNGGDLMFHIQQQGRFDEGRARFYAAEITTGLKFLHKKGIVYRDLKLDNILLDFDGHVRIADFGMCKLQIYLDRTADTFCGTPDYMAPEIIKGLKYNQCVDWWSFGILLYEMLVGQSPFSGCDEDDLFWCICNRQPHYPRFISLEAKRILIQLLEKESSKRLGSCENGAAEVMGHPFFDGLDWDRLERRELIPPFKPNVKHPLDVHYFDKHFTAERARLTPIDPSILQSMDQTQFQGFSYTNPNVTD